MSIRYVGLTFFVTCFLLVSNIAKADVSGYRCNLVSPREDHEVSILENREGYIKKCNPIEGDKRPKRITFLSSIYQDESGVCFFNERELNWDNSTGRFHFGEILYQRMALEKEGACPSISSDLYAAVPIGLSKKVRIESFSAIAMSFRDVQNGKMEVSKLFSDVSLFEKLFSAPFRDFKSALQEAVECEEKFGSIEGYSVLNKDNQIYVVYYRLGGISWHLEAQVENGKLKILGVSA